jgi:phage shock protein C
MPRRLTRDTRNAVLGGVAGGFARYFDVDPVLTRLAFILLCFAHGIGLIFYFICWAIMPREDSLQAPAGAGAPAAPTEPAGEAASGGSEAGPPAPAGEHVEEQMRAAGEQVRAAGEEVRAAGERVVENVRHVTREPGRGHLIGGTILIVIGLLFLVDRMSWFYWPHWLRFSYLWPLALVFVGVMMLIGANRERTS